MAIEMRRTAIVRDLAVSIALAVEVIHHFGFICGSRLDRPFLAMAVDLGEKWWYWCVLRSAIVLSLLLKIHGGVSEVRWSVHLRRRMAEVTVTWLAVGSSMSPAFLNNLPRASPCAH